MARYDDNFKARYKGAPISVYENYLYETAPHIHNELEIVFVIEGKTRATVGNEIFEAKKGDLIFVNPLEVHAFTPDTDNEYCHKCVCFDLSLVADKKVAEDLLNGDMAILHSIKDDVLSNLFLKLYDLAESEKDTILFDVTAVVSMMFSHLIEAKFFIRDERTEKQLEFCRRVTVYIKENYALDISSKDVARELFYTQSYFCRNFRENFNVSFSEYLNMHRVLMAKEKLMDKKLSISDVSQLCGFSSPEYFARVFKKSVGIPPNEYRKNQYSTENR